MKILAYCIILVFLITTCVYVDCSINVCRTDQELALQKSKISSVKRFEKYHDVKLLNHKDVDVIRNEILKHGVLAIPNQNLSMKDLMEFSRKFGNVFKVPLPLRGADTVKNYEEIVPVRNFWANGTCKGKKHTFGQYWHKDGDYLKFKEGYLWSILYAKEYDEDIQGGDTGFINACPKSIDENMRIEMANVSIKVSLQGIADAKSSTGRELLSYPEVSHKVLFKHPENGKQCVFLFKHKDNHEMFDCTLSYIEKPENRMNHKWKSGDILMWDNFGVFHRALPIVQKCQKRILFRTLVNVAL